MVNSISEPIRKLIENTSIPENDVISGEAITSFETAQDTLLMYRGDPSLLLRALRLFASIQVRPLIYAGQSFVVISGAYISSNKYDIESINYAYALYERAAQFGPNCLPIVLLKVTLLGHRNLIEEMRTTLDHIGGQFSEAQNNIGYIFGEMDYWKRRSDTTEFERWANLGLDLSQNKIHRVNILNRLAGTYLSLPKFSGSKEALTYYEKVVAIDPSDPWAWHNMSIIHRHNADYPNAAYCNFRALELMPFGNAYDVLRSIIERYDKERIGDPIKEVARYDVVTRRVGLLGF